DDYLELVKGRAYGSQGDGGASSAGSALALALATLLRLFAPILPFVTEEVWSWWQDGSVHRTPWSDAADLRAAASDDADSLVLDTASEVLAAIRREKTSAKQSLRAPVRMVTVRDTADRLAALARAAA